MTDLSADRGGSPPHAALPVALEILRRGPISRGDIARRLGLSHASLSRLSAPLLASGIIHDVGEHNDGRAGRPIRLLDVDASSRYFLGIKIREVELIAAVTDLRGDVAETRQVALRGHDVSQVVEQIASLAEEFSATHSITGIGIGIGGAVHDRRHLRSADFLGWHDVPLADMISEATGIPALVENDIVSLCEYEDWFGSARNDDRFAAITLGIGTGFGLVVNGQPIVNDDYGLGLVGHWPMLADGPECDQGHRGCAAALLNAEAMRAEVSNVRGKDTGFDELIELARERDPSMTAVLDRAARGVGVLIAAVSNLTVPQRIIIAGEGAALAELMFDTIVESARSLRDSRATLPEITISSGDNTQWARGAAVLAIQAFALGALTSSLPR